MKKILVLLGLASILFSCKKDAIDDTSNKLIGVWQVAAIKPYNAELSQLQTLVFNYGTYEFRRDNTFTYTNLNNNSITGTWTIDRELNKQCDDCASSYTYSLDLKSEITKGKFGEGAFSDLKLYTKEFTVSRYVEGVNRRFDYTLRKK